MGLMKLVFFAFAAFFGFGGLASAIEPVIFKLFPFPPSGNPTGFGLGLAVSEKYIVVGDYRDSSVVEEGGAVYVFDARTRRVLRRLVPNDLAAFDAFGYSVALWGDTVVVGAPFANEGVDADVGAVYVFNAKTGRQLHKFMASDGEASDELGTAVATNGELVLAGAPFDDVGAEVDAGSAMVFRLSDGAQLHRLTAALGAAGDEFGTSVAVSGDFGLVGAPKVDVAANPDQGRAFLMEIAKGAEVAIFEAPDGGAGDSFGFALALHGRSVVVGAGGADIGANGNQGAVYVMDLYDASLIRKLVAPDGEAGDFFGDAVAINGNYILIGSPFSQNGNFTGTGSAYLVDTATGGIWQKLGAIDGRQDDNLGYIVAMDASTVVIGAIGEDTFGVDTGAAYGFAPLSQPLPTLDLVKKGDFAPGIPEASLGMFSAFQVNGESEVLLAGGMTGRGAPAGRNKALWSNLDGYLRPVGMLGDSFIVGTRVVAHTNLVLAGNDWSSFFIKLAGTGITAGNDLALVASDGEISITRLFEGDALSAAPFAGEVLKQMVQMASAGTLSAIATKLNGPASKDSALVLHSLDVDVVEGGAIEGAVSPAPGVNLGQVAPRVAMNGGSAIGMAMLQAPTSSNAMLLRLQDNVANSMIARKGDVLAGAGELKSFLGETIQDGASLLRATLSGAAPALSEALVAVRTGPLELVAQKGTQVPGLPTGVKFSRFVRYVMLDGGKVLFLAKVSGPGVNASNDQVLVLSRSAGELLVLMREGQVADDCLGAKIGVIQQIDADPATGSYLVLTTLTGSPANANLAVWMGEIPALIPPSGEEFFVPKLRMRKGSYQSLAGNTSLLTSVKLLIPVDATGAVAKGMGKAVADGAAALQMTFANRQVLLGTLPKP